jgi:hypothetical protein
VKLDISKYVKKYIPEEFALSPEQQVEFNRRAYMEILEDCSNLLQVKQRFEKDIVPDFKVLFTTEGQPLLNMEAFKKFLIKRKTDLYFKSPTPKI